MAKINGLEIKALKKSRGHEGEPLVQGNLYLNGTKIGFWSQDSRGGPDRFLMEKEFSKQMLNDKVEQIYKGAEKTPLGTSWGHDFSYDLALLMEDLVMLKDLEETYKKHCKQENLPTRYDYGMLVIWSLHLDRRIKCFHYAKGADMEAVKEKALAAQAVQKAIQDAKKYDGSDPDIVWYLSKKDFEFGDSIQIEDIMLPKAETDWHNWKVGRKTTFHVEEFDGTTDVKGEITEVHDDHLLFEGDGMHMIVEDWNAHLFH